MVTENLDQAEAPVVETEVNSDVSLPEADDLFDPSPEEEGAEAPEETQEAAEEPEAEGESEEQAVEVVPENVKRAMDDVQRRDIELRQREQAVKQHYAAARELEELREAIKNDPLEAIQRAGGDPTTAMEALIGPDETHQQIAESPVVKKLVDKINSLEQNLTARDQAHQREVQQQHQARLYNEYSQAAAAASMDEHPLLNVFSDSHAPTTMFERAAAHAQQYNAVPTVQQLARETEQLLDQQAMDLIARLRTVPKYAKHFAPADGDGQKEPASTRTAPPPTGKTLRNRDTAEPPPAAREIDWSEATDSEVLERASKAVPDLFD